MIRLMVVLAGGDLGQREAHYLESIFGKSAEVDEDNTIVMVWEKSSSDYVEHSLKRAEIKDDVYIMISIEVVKDKSERGG